ncbi:hypothetical protein CTI12_AA583770 [Artemisia annua]|uniref:Myb/SANT-like domain-containing protein n=1 Tax=Artemisia annua TaxID=35608 RepID=A0A2U1KN07_ARTAN|nr:hypothetical protein CTI12_AA583770 [Artemisia annua]
MGKSDGAAKNDNDGATVKKESLSWTDQMDAAFIEALLSEQNAGNRPNGTFSSTAYNNIVKALNEKFNVTFEKEKLKNRIKTLKKYFNQFHDVFKGVALSDVFGEKGKPASDDQGAAPGNATLQITLELLSWKVISNVIDDKKVFKKILKEGESYERPKPLFKASINSFCYSFV